VFGADGPGRKTRRYGEDPESGSSVRGVQGFRDPPLPVLDQGAWTDA
jgi:hypothetical protein